MLPGNSWALIYDIYGSGMGNLWAVCIGSYARPDIGDNNGIYLRHLSLTEREKSLDSATLRREHRFDEGK